MPENSSKYTLDVQLETLKLCLYYMNDTVAAMF